jgi:2-keto-4-pentenoate hydratase/2-oxohepta-3-ene-1,7-dioic acid hydratase in catechol pathway
MARLVSYSYADRQSFGILEGDVIFDLPASSPELGAAGFAAALKLRTPEQLITLARNAKVTVPFAATQLLPPITDGEKCLCVGLNFKEHAREAGLQIPRKPSLFARFPSSFVGHGQPVLASFLSSQFDFEGELVVVIGRAGRHVTESQAMNHVLGYTIMAENSVRDWQRHSTQVTAGKNFFQSGAIGPWCVTRDDVGDSVAFNIVTRLNGSVVQQGNTDDFIFSIAEIISYVSSFAALLPGDMISLGTPSGVGMSRTPPLWLKAGDVLEVEIDAIGVLRNHVVAEAPERVDQL